MRQKGAEILTIRCGKIAYGLGLLLAGTAGAAAAQTPGMGGGQGPAGPNERRVEIRPSAQLIYDTNVYRVGEGFDLGGLARDDVRVTPSVDAIIALPVGRQTVFLNGNVGYDFYRRNSRLDRERIALSGGAQLRAGQRCSATVTGGYVRQQSDFTDVFATLAVPNTDERRSIDVQASCGGAVGLTPSFGYRHDESRNSSDLFRPLNTNSDTFNASLGYQRPTFGVLSIYGTYTTSAFPERRFLTPTGLVRDGVENYSAGISFERQIGRRITGTVALGYTWVNPRLDDTPDFRGVSYRAAIDVRPNDDFTVNLTASRNVEVQNFVAASYSITDLYGLTGTYQFNPRLRMNFGSSYQKRDFRAGPQLGGLPGFLLLPEDKVITGNVGLSYDVTRRLTLTTGFVQERRDSNNQIFNFKSSVVTAGISLLL
jgi:predicted porin